MAHVRTHNFLGAGTLDFGANCAIPPNTESAMRRKALTDSEIEALLKDSDNSDNKHVPKCNSGSDSKNSDREDENHLEAQHLNSICFSRNSWNYMPRVLAVLQDTSHKNELLK